MKNTLSGAVYGAIAAAAILVSLGATPAEARTPGGSYLQSCTNVRAVGDRVVATCRRPDGSWQRSAINDVHSCNGGLANANGQLVCGRHREVDGYGSSRDPRSDRSYRHDGWRGDYNYYGR